MRRCLILQFEPRHEEVIPSAIAACNAAGYRPTVLLSRRIMRLRGDIFEHVPVGQADIRYVHLNAESGDTGWNWADYLTDDIEFVVMNTFSRRRVVEWAQECGKPVIAIVHNVEQFTTDPALHEVAQRPDFAFMVLGAHVLSELIGRVGPKYLDKFGILASCVFGRSGQGYHVDSPRKVVVPGNMSLRSRSYMELIVALSENPGRWNNLVFEFPSSGVDRGTIDAEINARDLSSRMRVVPTDGQPEVPYSRLFESLNSACLLHPLIPPGFVQYQRIKITSTTSLSLGFGIPLVMDRWSEACYRFPMLVSDNTLAASLDRLSLAEDAELLAISQQLADHRKKAERESGREMRRLIERIV